MLTLVAAAASGPKARADDADRMRRLLNDASQSLVFSQAYGLFPQPSPSAGRAAELWTDIGVAQATLGDAKAASGSFDRAWRAGASIKDDFRRIYGVLSETTQRQASAGQVRKAMDHARPFAEGEE